MIKKNIRILNQWTPFLFIKINTIYYSNLQRKILIICVSTIHHIFHLIISVFEILPVVNTIAFNDEYMEDIFNIDEYKNKNFKINFSKKEYSERIGEMIKNIKLNQLNI